MVQINSAESNRAALRYIKEVTWGTTPASGNATAMRLKGSGLEASKETESSEEIRADRMVPSIIETAASTGGEIEMEFAAGSVDPFVEAFLLGAWTKTMNWWQVKGSAVTVTDANTITITGGDYTDYVANGQWIKLDGFLNPENNGYFLVASVPAYGSGATSFDVTATLIAEAGTAYSRVSDAGDVLINATTGTFTSGNTIDGGGANGFGSVEVGQRVYVEGLGKGSGSIVVTATDPTEGATITISDGDESYVFEVRTDAALVGEGNIHVALSGTPATQAASLKAAINAQFQKRLMRVTASLATATLTLTNHRGSGGSIATSDAVAFTVTSFAGGSATKSGFYTVASVIDNDTITVSETLSTDANVGTLHVLVKGSHVRNPGVVADITKQSFTIETGFTDVSKYFVMNGMRVGSLGFEVEAGKLVGATVSFQGRQTLNSSTETLTAGNGYTPLDSAATEVLNATSNVGSVYKDGTALTTAIKMIKMDGDASLREQRAIGEKFPAGIGYGRFSLSGEMEAYFETFDLYTTFINHTTMALGFGFTDVDYNEYFFRVPSMKITADPVKPEGIDQDVMEAMEWSAQRDPTLATQFMMDRFSSTWPQAVA